MENPNKLEVKDVNLKNLKNPNQKNLDADVDQKNLNQRNLEDADANPKNPKRVVLKKW